jgi:hypothetical protein
MLLSSADKVSAGRRQRCIYVLVEKGDMLADHLRQ